MAKTRAAPIYQLKVTLKGIRPPIWRRLLVPGNTSLDRLHDIIQIAMPWEDYHLHEFEIAEQHYGSPEPDWDDDVLIDQGYRLAQLDLTPKSKFTYTYDFGDGWTHDILVEAILEPAPGVRYPVCVQGKRACPPEDCGGIWGYAELLEAISDPDHPNYESMLTWLGEEFDPEAFDIEYVNARLGTMRSR